MNPASARQSRLARSTTASRTALSSNDVPLMICRTSAIAVSRAVGPSMAPGVLELFEAVDVDDEDGRAAHLHLDRIGDEEVTGLDQRWHRVHELAAGAAVLLVQPDDLCDPVVIDARHQGHVLVLQESSGAGETGHRNASVIEGIHGRRCIFAVHHGDQELHADRRSPGRAPACASASLTNARMRAATWSWSAAASTSRQRCGSAAAISWYPARTRW